MVCDKYPVNINNICLIYYNEGIHSCKYNFIKKYRANTKE